MDSEDATFDDVAGSVLAQYAKRRDELEEQYERDDLVSILAHDIWRSSLMHRAQLKGRPYSLLSSSEENNLIGILEARPRSSLTVAEAIILRKLKVQRVRIATSFSKSKRHVQLFYLFSTCESTTYLARSCVPSLLLRSLDYPPPLGDRNPTLRCSALSTMQGRRRIGARSCRA